MVYGSVCSGIEAATLAWHWLGWRASFFSEIEKFPRAVLAHRWPLVPLHGDFTTIEKDQYEKIDLLVGGTPCQSFSVAGLRRGMDDERGNLALEFIRLVQRLQPKWVVWENVPGVLSSNGGQDFGSFVGALVECGYGFAYRVLDAQNFGVPQRRRRVFVVGYLGDWRPPAAILFEPESLRRDIAKGRKSKQAVTGTTGKSIEKSCIPILESRGRTGRSTTDNSIGMGIGKNGDPMFTLQSSIQHGVATYAPNVCSTLNAAVGKGKNGQDVGSLVVHGSQDPIVSDKAHPIGRNQGQENVLIDCVRRLTPIECERLMGMQDNYTRIPWRNKAADQCPNGPRYKAIGNSMAVPVMRWIGERIQMFEDS